MIGKTHTGPSNASVERPRETNSLGVSPVNGQSTALPKLPAPIAYLVDAPTIAITIVLAPIRALASPWTGTPDFDRTAAQAGYRYLLRFPQGEEMRPVVDWLYEYESGRERWGRALRMADWIPEFDEEKRLELVEKTAAERLARIDQVDRRDTRASTLRGIAQEFPDSDGGQIAGLQARSDREEASPQHIRITRDFLFENPSVAGPEGIGLNAKLLNKKLSDGELHPDGVILRGGLCSRFCWSPRVPTMTHARRPAFEKSPRSGSCESPYPSTRPCAATA